MQVLRACFAVLVAMVLGTAPAAAQDHPDGVHVHDAYARVVGGQGASGAVYFIIHNNTDHVITLTGVTCDLAQMAGLHTSAESADGLMQMLPLDGGVVLPPGEMHEFVGGGDHVMLMGLTQALTDGQSIPLTLTFDGAEALRIVAIVDNARAPGGTDQADPAAMDGHSMGHDHSAMTPAP